MTTETLEQTVAGGALSASYIIAHIESPVPRAGHLETILLSNVVANPGKPQYCSLSFLQG